jgi:hypothetical protein
MKHLKSPYTTPLTQGLPAVQQKYYAVTLCPYYTDVAERVAKMTREEMIAALREDRRPVLPSSTA